MTERLVYSWRAVFRNHFVHVKLWCKIKNSSGKQLLLASYGMQAQNGLEPNVHFEQRIRDRNSKNRVSNRASNRDQVWNRDVMVWKFLITIIVTKIITVISFITVLFKCAVYFQKVQTHKSLYQVLYLKINKQQIKWLFVCIITKTITLPVMSGF